MEVSNISRSVFNFVSENLSQKSQEYILYKLFENDLYINKFLSECLPMTIKYKGQKIGSLNQAELQLFVIKDSLLKRIKGTRRRINELDWSIQHPNGAEQLFKKEQNSEFHRLEELFDDFNSIKKYLDSLIEKRLKKKMELVFSKKLDISRVRYGYQMFGDSFGYIFVVFNTKIIALDNGISISGD